MLKLDVTAQQMKTSRGKSAIVYQIIP